MKKLSDKGSFEKHWEDAFRNAEKKPPDAVWDKINAELTGMEISGYKKRLFLFKWLAAASVMLALGLGFYSLYLHKGLTGSTENSMADTELSPGTMDGSEEMRAVAPGNTAGEKVTGKSPAGRDDGSVSGNERSGTRNLTYGMQPAGPATGPVRSRDNQSFGAGGNASGKWRAVAGRASVKNGEQAVRAAAFPYLVQMHPLTLSFPDEKPALPVAFMYRRPVVPVNFKTKGRGRQPVQFYAGLNFSTGRFNPNYEVGEDAASLSSADLAVYSRSSARVSAGMNTLENTEVARESYQPDLSYSYGLNMGAKLAKRWILRGGLNYVKANSLANTTAYIQDHKNDERYPVLKAVNYESDGVVEIRQTESTAYKNAFEFASVPLKAGYIIVDKKLDLVLFGGVSSEFFLKNTITSEDNQTNSVTNVPGSDSPYKTVHFNGLLSTALGYTIAGHYRLSLEPGYRMALNAFTKESFILTGKPDAFYINFGVSYRFK